MEQTKKGVRVDKKEEKERKKEEGKERIGEETNRREKKNKKKKVFRFFLGFMEIKPWVFVAARGKVGPCKEDYAWVPKSRGFVKL